MILFLVRSQGFQSTFPRRERHTPFSSHRSGRLFQSTFPRRERLYPESSLFHFQKISIHVPTKGTTTTDGGEVDPDVISIHVPTKGTTVIFVFIKTSYSKFQSTFPRRERPSPLQISSNLVAFQSTFPRRERPNIRLSGTVCCDFNPRSHEGNDSIFPQFFRKFYC